MISKTQWGELDILLVDVPRQNGDISFVVYESMKVSGGVVVVTPLEEF